MKTSDAPSRPPHLRPGDLVRVIAPSSPFKADDLAAGVAVLESWGLRVRTREDIHDRRLYLAGTPERRAEELHEAFDDPETAAVLAVRGGYGLTTVLPLLDVQRLQARPTIVVGCSDITALLALLVDHAAMTCLHGPMVASLGRGGDPTGAEALRAALFSSTKPSQLSSALDDPMDWCISPGVGRGRSIGGSLSLVAALCGTPWQPKTAGRVLFLEDVGERPYRIDRLLTQCEAAGLFDDVAGIVLGDFTGCDEPGGAITWRDAVRRVFRRLSVPVLAGLSFGHGKPNLPIPMGARVELDAGAGWLKFRDATWSAATLA